MKKARWCPLAEVHISGENADDHHGGKHTGSYGSYALHYVSHTDTVVENGRRVSILLTDGRMHVTVNYDIFTRINTVRAWTKVENIGTVPVGLEYVFSFAYTGLDDAITLGADQRILVGIPHNGWYREANGGYTLPQLGLDRISSFSSKRLSFSNTGTWSCKEYLPMGFVCNEDTRRCWLWQIEHNGSWQWELSEIDKMLYVKLGGPNEQEHQWCRELKPGERFESVPVALSLAENFEGVVREMTSYRRAIFQNSAENVALPVIFNDYMN